MITKAREVTESRLFHGAIISTILLAGVLSGIETVPSAVAAHGTLLRALDATVLGIFTIEVILKLVAHSPQPWRYFKNGWNVFDFTIVVLCLLPMDSQFAVVLRLGRTLRLLRLVSALPKLQLLVGALIKSFSSMGYVGLLLGLVFYIYAITGCISLAAMTRSTSAVFPRRFSRCSKPSPSTTGNSYSPARRAPHLRSRRSILSASFCWGR